MNAFKVTLVAAIGIAVTAWVSTATGAWMGCKSSYQDAIQSCQSFYDHHDETDTL
jgi:hypothetical protein